MSCSKGGLMKTILTVISLIISTTAFATDFNEIATLKNTELDTLSNELNTLTEIPELGNCSQKVHKLQMIDLNQQYPTQAIQGYISDYANITYDFGLLIPVQDDYETRIATSIRVLGEDVVTPEVESVLSRTSAAITRQIMTNQNLIYAGGLGHYFKLKSGNLVELDQIINFRMIFDLENQQVLLLSLGHCEVK